MDAERNFSVYKDIKFYHSLYITMVKFNVFVYYRVT